MIPDPVPPFEVDASGRIRERIRRMIERAAGLGIQPAITRSLSAVLEHLTNDPWDWGDPLWHYSTLQMTQFGGTTHGFRCEYSVHDRIPTVVITELFPLAGSPLYGENFDD